MLAMTNKKAVRERGTIDDAVAILGVCARTVRQLALRGELPREAKIGRRWTFNLECLREYVKWKEIEACPNAKHPRERSGAVRFSGGGFRPVVGTSNGRYVQTIQRLRSAGALGHQNDRTLHARDGASKHRVRYVDAVSYTHLTLPTNREV